MFGKKKDKRIAGAPVTKLPSVDGSDQTIAKVQGLGMEIVTLRSELDKARSELARELKANDDLTAHLDMANGRVAILEGIIANTFNSVMVADAPKTVAPVQEAEALNW